MDLAGIGGDLYEARHPSSGAGGVSPYKKICRWVDEYPFLDGKYVRLKADGRDTDLRKVGFHCQEDEDLFHKKRTEAFFIQSKDYGVLLTSEDENKGFSLLNGMIETRKEVEEYHIAAVIGLANLDYGYGDLVSDEEFERVAQDLNEFTDIDSFLTSRGVYVDEVNGENSGSGTFKYHKKTEKKDERVLDL